MTMDEQRKRVHDLAAKAGRHPDIQYSSETDIWSVQYPVGDPIFGPFEHVCERLIIRAKLREKFRIPKWMP